MTDFNPNSPTQISILFFGGLIQEETVEPVLLNGVPLQVKSGKNAGQLKTQKRIRDKKIFGLGLKPLQQWKTKKEGIYQTNEEVLKLISQKDSDAGEISKIFLKIRELQKQINTYYTGVEELIYDTDSCVHASFNHCSTNTSRLSCNKPNIQNVPTGYSRIKEHFISRYKDGKIISADYSQLELRIQAQLSKDENYINDINSGIDFHSKRVAMKEGRDYEEVKQDIDNRIDAVVAARSSAKAFSFARAYGAGKRKISEQTGMSEEEVQTLIENEDQEYPRLKLWNDYNFELVNKQGYYTDPWGRRYNFTKYPKKFHWQKEDSYSPTEIKNFCIQGHATGNIVLVMLGYFWRTKALLNRDKYLLINTVHDSVMLDCRCEYLKQAKEDLKILEEVDYISQKYFNYKMVVPVTIDISYGETWFDC